MEQKYKNFDHLNLLVHMEHLFCFSYFEISCYVDSPIFEDFIEFTKSNMTQFDETSLDKIEIGAVLSLVLKGLTTMVIIENEHIARRTKVFDFGLSI